MLHSSLLIALFVSALPPLPGQQLNESALCYSRASLIAQLVKILPAMLETPDQSLGWEDPLEKGKATHSSVLAWRIPCTVCYAQSPSPHN